MIKGTNHGLDKCLPILNLNNELNGKAQWLVYTCVKRKIKKKNYISRAVIFQVDTDSRRSFSPLRMMLQIHIIVNKY